MDNQNAQPQVLPPAYDIQMASPNQIKQVGAILGSAFWHDPVMNWLCHDQNLYASLFYSDAMTLFAKHNLVYINKEGTGAAMWLPPGIPSKIPLHWRLIPVAYQLIKSGGLSSLKRLRNLDSVFNQHHPKEPHFYLHAIGADMVHQGRGVGSALLKAGLNTCDHHGMPAYLESSNEKNNALYERHGFKIRKEAKLENGSPSVWFMYREANTHLLGQFD